MHFPWLSKTRTVMIFCTYFTLRLCPMWLKGELNLLCFLYFLQTMLNKELFIGQNSKGVQLVQWEIQEGQGSNGGKVEEYENIMHYGLTVIKEEIKRKIGLCHHMGLYSYNKVK